MCCGCLSRLCVQEIDALVSQTEAMPFEEVDHVCIYGFMVLCVVFVPLTDTLNPQSNGPLYSNTVIGTLAVDWWAVTFGTANRGLGGLEALPSPLITVPNVTAHPSINGQCTNFILVDVAP